MLKELNRSEIKTILQEKTVAHMCFFDGVMPCMAAVRYLYDEPHILAYSLIGKKMENMPEHREVCFEVDNIQEEDSWSEICIWGKYKVLTDPADIKDSIKKLKQLKEFNAELLAPKLKAHQTSKSRRQNSPVLFRIEMEHVTGYSNKSNKEGKREVTEIPPLKEKIFAFSLQETNGQQPPLFSAG